MRVGEKYEAVAYSFVGFRFRLGIGVGVYHEEGKLIKVPEKDGTVMIGEFDGLSFFLPFMELLWGELFFRYRGKKVEVSESD